MYEARSGPYIVYDRVEARYSELVYGLHEVSLEIHRGDFVFFVGQTGAGKSTMLKLLSREVNASSGRVMLNGRDVGQIKESEVPMLRRELGIVPQDFALLPRKRVWENVAYAMRAIGASRREVRKRVPEILEQVNIGHRADAFPHELSGGEQQRVAIARALINNPPLLLADEPTGNLDPQHSWEIMEVLLHLNLRGTTILVASHDITVVTRTNKRIVTLAAGRIVSDNAHRPEPEPAPPEVEASMADLPPMEGPGQEPEPEVEPEIAAVEEILPLTREEVTKGIDEMEERDA